MSSNKKFKEKTHDLIDSLVNQLKDLEKIVNTTEIKTPSEENSVEAEDLKNN